MKNTFQLGSISPPVWIRFEEPFPHFYRLLYTSRFFKRKYPKLNATKKTEL